MSGDIVNPFLTITTNTMCPHDSGPVPVSVVVRAAVPAVVPGDVARTLGPRASRRWWPEDGASDARGEEPVVMSGAGGPGQRAPSSDRGPSQ